MVTAKAEHNNMPYNDNELIIQIKQGSQTAFDILVGKYMAVIRSKASMYKIQAADNDDFIQEGLLTLLNAAKTYSSDGSASFATYFSVCVSNRFASMVRSSMRKKDIPIEMMVSLEDFNGKDTAANPEQSIIDHEDYAAMETHIKAVLSELEYNVLTCYLNGEPYNKISAKLNLTEKAVDNALQRIRNKLKQRKK